MFARLLDDTDGGHFSVRPTGDAEVTRRYVDGSLVLATRFETSDGVVELTDALAMADGVRGHDLGDGSPHVLLRRAVCTEGQVDLSMAFAPRYEYGLTTPLVREVDGGVLARGGPVALRLSSDLPMVVDGPVVHATQSLSAGDSASFAVSYGSSWEAPPDRWTAEQIADRIDDTVAAWRSWQELHQRYDGPYQDLVGHSGRVLHGLTFQPTGAIVAAPTTSLPEVIGGERNWDYRYAWVRDASLTLDALAIRDRRIVSSPCEDTKLPDDVARPVVPLATEQVLALEEAMTPRLQAFVTVDAATGLRQGELAGLTVDRTGLRPPSHNPLLVVDRQLVTVTGQPAYLGPPKSKASSRKLPLPRVAVEALAAHLAAYPPEAQEIVVRDAAGRARTETVELVFTNTKGTPLRRQSLERAFRRAVKAAGLPKGTTPHDLRHYYASLLIQHGESVKVVQARLGHATAGETLDTYAHLWPDAEDTTRDAIDSVLGAPADSVRTETGSD